MQWFVWVHAACMMTSVFLILPLGLLTARYRLTPAKLSSLLPARLRARLPVLSTSFLSDAAAPQPSWLLLHSSFLFLSGFLMLAGAACMFLSLERHARSVHAVLGLGIVAVVVFVQPRDVSAGQSGEIDRHKTVGWLLYAACTLNVALGLWMALSPTSQAPHT